jgi:hypothetical protein
LTDMHCHLAAIMLLNVLLDVVCLVTHAMCHVCCLCPLLRPICPLRPVPAGYGQGPAGPAGHPGR